MTYVAIWLLLWGLGGVLLCWPKRCKPEDTTYFLPVGEELERR